MGIEALLQTLTFSQILTLFSIVALPLLAIIAYIAIRGFSVTRHNTRIQIGNDGKTVKVSRSQMYNVVLLLETLKTKDDISSIDSIVFKRQKRQAKELTMSIRDSLLTLFRAVLCNQCSFNEVDSHESVLSHRDYLYFSLLADKIHTRMLHVILEDFEANGLATKAHPEKYATDRSNIVLEEMQSITNSLFLGIKDVPKVYFDEALSNKLQPFQYRIKELYMRAIQTSKQGQKKKQSLENYLFEKVGQMEGISEDQFKKLFSQVQSDDFLEL